VIRSIVSWPFEGIALHSAASPSAVIRSQSVAELHRQDSAQRVAKTALLPKNSRLAQELDRLAEKERWTLPQECLRSDPKPLG
jgi:hypothetical protein